jgi:LPXTG-site transpeptidase (sortase) family protein
MPAALCLRGSRLGRFASAPALLLALSLLVVACSSSPKHKPLAAKTTPQVPTATPTATATPLATATPDPAPLAAFLMPEFKVNAKIVKLGLDPTTKAMESPSNPYDVGYYTFTSPPGSGCQAPGQCANTVLSGHVDWYTGITGVFWNLRSLKVGDPLQLRLADGKVYTYKVTVNVVYSGDSAPVAQIVGAQVQPTLTLITCDGVFNKATQEYNNRRVVRAVLVS